MTTKRKCAGKCGKVRIASQFSSAKARVCTPCKRETQRKNARTTRLRVVYGLTAEEDLAIAVLQGKKCAGCKQPRRYNLHVDHDHKVEKALLAKGVEPGMAARLSVRGKLCARCNKVLRDIRDNAEALESLAEYLRNPPAKRVLR